MNPADVAVAVSLAVEKAQQSITSAYIKATRSVHKESLFPQVLLACALAEKDDLGYFTSSDVREPMSTIMGKPYDIAAYAKHLNQFSSEKRGMVLKKSGEERNYFYRFENPLLQPFIILNGIARGLISRKTLRDLVGVDEIGLSDSPIEP